MTLYLYFVLFIVGVVRLEYRVDCFEGNFCRVGGFFVFVPSFVNFDGFFFEFVIALVCFYCQRVDMY